MNKEEILNAFLLANIPEIITQEEFNDVKKEIKHLLQENKKYKEVIEKAIEKLEEVKERRIMLLDEKKVLDILKGVE